MTSPARGGEPITKGPWVLRVSSDSAVIRVETDPPGPVTVEVGVGLSEGEGHRVLESTEPRALHAVAVTGLRPGTRYAYAVRARGSSRSASFVTAPAPGKETNFRFLAYGDNRSDDAAHAAVVRAMAPVASDFVVHTGDFVERGESLPQWQTFFAIEAPLLATRGIFPSIGNHELTDGSGIQYARLFGPTDDRQGSSGTPRPEDFTSTFRWGNARFFMLNGMVRFDGTRDRAWLEKALSDSDAEPGIAWRIVALHHGPWSSGPHGGNARLHDAGIPALLKAHKVDLILSGHDHIYERGWADGLAYIVTGGGGAPIYKVTGRLPESRIVESVRHFVELNVSPSAIRIDATRSDGSTIERCALGPNRAGWDCDPVPKTGSLPRVPESSSRCSCDVVGAAPDGGHAFATILGALALGLRRARRRP